MLFASPVRDAWFIVVMDREGVDLEVKVRADPPSSGRRGLIKKEGIAGRRTSTPKAPAWFSNQCQEGGDHVPFRLECHAR